MPKGNPIRIDEELLRSAKRSGARLRRSAAEQVEHWADIGRRFEGVVSHDVLDDIVTGQVRVRIEEVAAEPVDAADLFAELDSDRDSGRLASMVSEVPVRYQASRSHPGKLERVDADGAVTLGSFRDGEFVAADDAS